MRVLPGLLAPLPLVLAFFLNSPSPHYPLADAAVRVTMATGMGESVGSGIHLGGDYILTAAHVVEGEGVIAVYTGPNDFIIASVVLLDLETDIAILRTKEPLPAVVASVEVSCRTPRIGETIAFVGNPVGLWQRHAWGIVSTQPEKREKWKSAFTFDGVAIPGMSGGGGRDIAGKLVAVLVGALSLPISEDALAPVGFGMAVPSSVFCPMLKEAGVM